MKNKWVQYNELIVPAIYYLQKCMKYLHDIYYNVYTIYISKEHMRLLKFKIYLFLK